MNRNIAKNDPLILEVADLIAVEPNLTAIMVDKQIFDDFHKDCYINISFADVENTDDVYQFKMVDETADGILMEQMFRTVF